MRKIIIGLFAIIFGSINAPTVSWALGENAVVQGGSYRSAGPVTETLQYGDLKTSIQRTPVFVPEAYGKLVTITSAKGVSTLWFQNDSGVVRNVQVSNSDLWLIQRSGTFSN